MSALAELYTLPQEHVDFRDTIRQIAQEIQRLVIARTLR